MIAMAMAALLSAETPAAPPPQPTTPQAIFDAASADVTSGKCADALQRFAGLEADPRLARSPNTLAVIALRKGDCLLFLGRQDEAQIALATGMARLNSDAPAYRADVARARMDLGRIAYRRLDYAAAERQFTLADPAGGASDRLDRLLWLSRATMFDPGDQAETYADQALALAAATPGTPKKTLADLHTLHARVLLNHGRQREAYGELQKALYEEGGLTLRVGVSDVVTRSDLAIAALLNNDKEAARKFLVYSGSGRLDKGLFASAASMDPLPCGGAADLRPDDVAIVEFGVDDDGSVSYADPIYVSRTGPAAVAFARAVDGWSWRPEDAKVLQPLFRLVNRVELRCSMAGEHPSTTDLLWPDVAAWLAKEKAPTFSDPALAAAAVAPERAELARREASGSIVALVPVLIVLVANPVIDVDQRRDWLVRLRDITVQAAAPPTVRAYVEIALANFATAARKRAGRRSGADRAGGELRDLLLQSAIAADPRAAAALRLEIAQSHAPSSDEQAQLLNAVATDARLSPHDPFRVGALLRLASLEARTGDLAAARTSYAQTGLTAQQCALVDAKPEVRSRAPGSAAFPEEALRWGFEGWVRTEFDIAPDGATLNARAVIAYPPFVFRDAAVGIAKDLRFTQTYRPEGGAGCSGAEQKIVFRLQG